MVSAEGEQELEFWKTGEGAPESLTQQPGTGEFPREESSTVLEVMKDEILLDIVTKRSLESLVRIV